MKPKQKPTVGKRWAKDADWQKSVADCVARSQKAHATIHAAQIELAETLHTLYWLLEVGTAKKRKGR